MTKHQESD